MKAPMESVRLQPWVRLRGAMLSAVTLVTFFMIDGCATAPPAQDADFGNPYPLMDLVMSGQINPNDSLPARPDGSQTLTPLCALITYLTAAPAVDILLNKGADVNKPCRTRSGGDALNRALAASQGAPDLPLDIVIEDAVNRGTIPSPYTANPRYRPQDLPALYVYAEKLIQRGGKSKTGAMSLDQVKQRVSKGIDFGNEHVAEQKEKLAEENRNSFFNANTLMGVVAIAGATAENYVAQSNNRSLQTPGSVLPLAHVQPIATERRSAATRQQLANNESTQVASNSTNTASNANPEVKPVYVGTNSTSNSGRPVHEVEDDWSPYKGWAVIARGDHMASREASCNDGNAKVARILSSTKTVVERPVKQSPCLCTKWWNDDRAVHGMWQCAILGQYTGKTTAVEK